LLALTAVVAPKAAPDIPLGLLTLSVSFAALFVSWRLVSDLLESRRDAALLVFCVYFGSPLWFYSRTFFTEPYTWAFAVFAIAGVRTKRVGIATTFLALVLAMKETAVLLVIAILIGSLKQLARIRKACPHRTV
jgi:Gpi18-like mannosyltransferase